MVTYSWRLQLGIEILLLLLATGCPRIELDSSFAQEAEIHLLQIEGDTWTEGQRSLGVGLLPKLSLGPADAVDITAFFSELSRSPITSHEAELGPGRLFVIAQVEGSDLLLLVATGARRTVLGLHLLESKLCAKVMEVGSAGTPHTSWVPWSISGSAQ